jgi:hypothetical protein
MYIPKKQRRYIYMELYYNRTGAERKELVAAIAEITGEKSKYLGAPSMAYQIGDYQVSKEGILSGPDSDDLTLELSNRGFEGECREHEVNISIPLEYVDVGNLIHLLDAKGELIKKALGIENTFIKEEDETVTFPWFKDLTPDEVQTYTKFISALCKMSVTQKRVTAKAKEVENEKYAFRCFLLRLGFIGDEFKADRKILLSKLDGSAAFKCGHKKGGEE